MTLPRLIEVTAHVPVSMSLQREDFRNRLSAGHSLSLAELLYSVAMALDSVEVRCDLEVGGLDQFLNMQMCRKVMEICGQEPELVVATALLEGTDGTGAKMSKSRGNYVPLTAPGRDIRQGDVGARPPDGALPEGAVRMAVERARHRGRTAGRRFGAPHGLKKIVAGEVTAALHGVDVAMAARDEFAAQFSRRRLRRHARPARGRGPLRPVVEVVKSLGFAASNSEVRRVAEQKGLRLVVEPAGGAAQEQVPLTPDDIRQPLADVLESKFDGASGDYYLKVGRRLARINP